MEWKYTFSYFQNNDVEIDEYKCKDPYNTDYGVIRYVHDGSNENCKTNYLSVCKLLTAADTYRVNPVTGYENKYVYAVYMPELWSHKN